jgi:hypothetical protein
MEAKLCFIGHALMENRSGLIVDTHASPASPAMPSASLRSK